MSISDELEQARPALSTPSERRRSVESLRIVVTDPMQVRLQRELEEATAGDHEWHFLPYSEIAPGDSRLSGADAYVGSALTDDDLGERSRLRLVQVAGAGFDKVTASLPTGCVLANTHHHGPAIAEYAIMTMLMFARRVLAQDRLLRRHSWDSVFQDTESSTLKSLAGAQVGIVGLGEIGENVARLSAALGADVSAVTRSPSLRRRTELGLTSLGGLDELVPLARRSDFLVLAVPLNASTEAIIDDDVLAAMPRESVLINVSRGGLVDEGALFDRLRRKDIAGAALDVWWNYPQKGAWGAPSRYPFASLDNVIMTPHTSGVTESVFVDRMADVAFNLSVLAQGGGEYRNVVTVA